MAIPSENMTKMFAIFVDFICLAVFGSDFSYDLDGS